MTPRLAAAMIADTAREVSRCVRDLNTAERSRLVDALKAEPLAGEQARMFADLLMLMSEAAHSRQARDLLDDAAGCMRDIAIEELGQWEHEQRKRL